MSDLPLPLPDRRTLLNSNNQQFNSSPNNNFSKVFGIISCVFVFIISSYEHCIANMFYISIADLWSIKSFLYMLLMILGNSIGGLLIPGLSKIIKITE